MRLRASLPAALVGFWIAVRSIVAMADELPPTHGALLLAAAFALPVLPVERIMQRFDVLRVAFALLVVAGLAAGSVAGAAAGAAGGAMLLFAAVGHIDRRSIMLAAATAITAHHAVPLAAQAGPGEPLVMRLTALLLLASLLTWLRQGWRTEESRVRAYERRAGGMRLRGALLLATALYVHIVLLAPATPAIATAAAFGAAAAAVMLGLAPAVPVSSRTLRVGVGAAAATAAAALGSGLVSETATAAPMLAAVASATATVMVAVALIPAGGRRPGRSVAAGLLLLPILLLWRPDGAALLTALAVLPLVAALLPRSLPMRGALRRG